VHDFHPPVVKLSFFSYFPFDNSLASTHFQLAFWQQKIVTQTSTNAAKIQKFTCRISITNNNNRMKKIALALIVMLLANLTFAQKQFEKRTYISPKNDTLRYQVLLPLSYESGKKFPLVIFLHGSGERSSDNMLQLKHGSRMFSNPVNMEKYPAIVLFPQCPTNGNWIKEFPKRNNQGEMDWKEHSNDSIATPLLNVKELIEKYIAEDKVDPKRIYVVGLSMGGMGTFDLAARYPQLFAAAIPICGGIYPPRLKDAAKQVKFRIYHGDADQVVSSNGSRDAYLALKEFGANVTYFEFPGVEHNSWNPAFNQPDFFEWLFKQKRK
jgi:predicted peptidase